MQNDFIRKAALQDICRIAEIEIFNYRTNFYPIFGNDKFYFNELQVTSKIKQYENADEFFKNAFVYDDGVVKGFIWLKGIEVKKLFVEPALQNQAVGASLLEYVILNYNASFLWALEKNTRAIGFYIKHGFHFTGEKVLEEGTTEFLAKLVR